MCNASKSRCNAHLVYLFMKPANLSIYSNSDALAQAFAEHFAQKADEAIRARGRFLAVLSGGGTPLKAFRLLAREPLKSQMDWQHVHLFWGDERHIAHDDSGSNFYQAREALLKYVPLPEENLHPMPTHLAPRDAAKAYRRTIASFAEASRKHVRFDLVMLGLGSDGHTASLFVGQSAQWTSPVITTEGEYDGRPAVRLTLTPQVINRAREVVFLVSGAAKAQALANALGDEQDIDRFPAQAIAAESLHWMTDEEAAKNLSASTVF